MPANLFDMGDNQEFIIESSPSLAKETFDKKHKLMKNKNLYNICIIFTS